MELMSINDVVDDVDDDLVIHLLQMNLSRLEVEDGKKLPNHRHQQ